ncbi:MAG: hypothetical protein KAI47_12295, partial [Deltaproteobacteria bacterium]|nr:hypothetical protein [Deltaproteobacteria bacterium]
MRRVLVGISVVGMSVVVVVGLGFAGAGCSDSAQQNVDARNARDVGRDGPHVLDAKGVSDFGGDAGHDASRDAFVYVDAVPRDALVHVDAAKQDAKPVDSGHPDASTGGFSVVSARYAKMLEQSIDYWHVLNVSTFTTGHFCKKTDFSACAPAYCNKPYVTPKIHRLAGLMVSLAKVYPYVNSAYQTKVLAALSNMYFWLYARIDWASTLVSDDYGACYKGDTKAYSHLTTALVVQGFRAFRSVLSKSDPKYTKLSNVTESLAVSQMNATDYWMTPIGATPKAYSTNYMALNLSVVSVINSVNPKNAYLANLGHRLKTDYAWIRKAWVNYANEQYCGVPLLYGGWSHSPPDQAAKNKGVTFDCKYFDQTKVDVVSKSIRSYYLEKTSYHVITTEGLMN